MSEISYTVYSSGASLLRLLRNDHWRIEALPAPRNAGWSSLVKEAPGRAIRIVVAADYDGFREMLCRRLRRVSDLKVTRETRDGWETIASVARLIPDMLILDMDLSMMSGLEVLRLVRWLSPQTKVIILSDDSGQATILEALKQGAMGYIGKGDLTDLEKAILAVHRGEVWARRRVLATVIEERMSLTVLTSATTEEERVPA